jgi:hypothetical protein
MLYLKSRGYQMLNQGNNVPDKTIAVVVQDFNTGFDYSEIDSLISKPSKKRDWFDPHFYRCLPLTIGNQYGYVIKCQYDFSIIWNGGNTTDDLVFEVYETAETLNKKYPRIDSHFGHGIATIDLPFTLRTPPNVNLMTINPPNTILPNITVMTGVVESDNLRRSFTINLKVQVPNMKVFIPAGTPIAGILPIPRYYGDEFKLVNARDIFSEELVDEEVQSIADALIKRTEIEFSSKNRVGQDYLKGRDVYGNLFPDHQKP